MSIIFLPPQKNKAHSGIYAEMGRKDLFRVATQIARRKGEPLKKHSKACKTPVHRGKLAKRKCRKLYRFTSATDFLKKDLRKILRSSFYYLF